MKVRCEWLTPAPTPVPVVRRRRSRRRRERRRQSRDGLHVQPPPDCISTCSTRLTYDNDPMIRWQNESQELDKSQPSSCNNPQMGIGTSTCKVLETYSGLQQEAAWVDLADLGTGTLSYSQFYGNYGLSPVVGGFCDCTLCHRCPYSEWSSAANQFPADVASVFLLSSSCTAPSGASCLVGINGASYDYAGQSNGWVSFKFRYDSSSVVGEQFLFTEVSWVQQYGTNVGTKHVTLTGSMWGVEEIEMTMNR